MNACVVQSLGIRLLVSAGVVILGVMVLEVMRPALPRLCLGLYLSAQHDICLRPSLSLPLLTHACACSLSNK